MKNSILAVVCARQTGSRLPNKTMSTIGSMPVIGHILLRLEQSDAIRKTVLAIPEGKGQDMLKMFAVEWQTPVILGPEHDVVERFDIAVRKHYQPGDYILRVLSDQPFVDWEAIDNMAAIVQSRNWDFALPLSFSEDPVYGGGNSPWSFRTWNAIAQGSKNDEREHPGMWLRRNLGKWNYGLVDLPHWMYRPYRLELDAQKDLEMFRMVQAAWNGERPPSLRWVVQFLDRHPNIAAMNSDIHEKTGTYTSFTQQEIQEWHRDYAEREIVWSETGMLGTMQTQEMRRRFACEKCGGALMALTVTAKNDLLTKCARCGEKRTFYSERPKRGRIPIPILGGASAFR